MRAVLLLAGCTVVASSSATTGRTLPRELPASVRDRPVPVPPSAGGAARAAPLRFGYYEDNLTATPYATLHQASSVADVAEAWSALGVPSLLLVDVFTSVPGRMVLQTDWLAQLNALAAAAAPLFASGAALGYNLGDELVWNCLAPSNLTAVANAVRAVCPPSSCVVWYNEAAVFHTPAFVDSCGNAVTDYSIPTALDWFSTDIYHTDGTSDGWVDYWVRGFYEVSRTTTHTPPSRALNSPPPAVLDLPQSHRNAERGARAGLLRVQRQSLPQWHVRVRQSVLRQHDCPRRGRLCGVGKRAVFTRSRHTTMELARVPVLQRLALDAAQHVLHGRAGHGRHAAGVRRVEGAVWVLGVTPHAEARMSGAGPTSASASWATESGRAPDGPRRSRGPRPSPRDRRSGRSLAHEVAVVANESSRSYPRLSQRLFVTSGNE
jgi:hypothetical protein